MNSKTSIYDEQAVSFDKRVGLEPVLCKQIAEAVKEIDKFNQSDMLLEIGCGTGQIGSMLATMYKRYVGIDLSSAMLEQFKNLNITSSMSLIQADCNQAWPVPDHSTNTFFSSRAIHWINVEHIINEVQRTANKGQSLFIVGRVERTSECWESKLKKQCHKLLKENQITARDGNNHLKILRKEFQKNKAEVLPHVIVNQWEEQRSLVQSLKNWANKSGLAGANPTEKVKQDILVQLKDWAYGEYGTKLPMETERHYVLHGFKLAS